MSKIIKINKSYYELNPKNFELKEIETPEKIENIEVFDGTNLHNFIDGDYDGTQECAAAQKFNEKVSEYKTKKETADTLKSKAVDTESIKKAKESFDALETFKPEIAVLKHAIGEKDQLLASLKDASEGEKDLELIEKTVEPEPETTQPDTPEADTAEKTVEPEPTEPEPIAAKNSEETEPTEDTQPQAPITTESLIAQTTEVIEGEKRPNIVTRHDQFLDRHTPVVADKAEFVTASIHGENRESMTTGSGQWLDYVANRFQNYLSSNSVAHKADIGRYKRLTGEIIRSGHNPTQDFRLSGQDLAVTASAGGCYVDQRDDITTCDYLRPDLTTLFQNVAADCQFSYRKKISVWDLQTGVTGWDADRSKRFCDARDAYMAAIKNPESTNALLAELKAGVEKEEKPAAMVGCLDWFTTKPFMRVVARLALDIGKAQCDRGATQEYLNCLEQLKARMVNSYIMSCIDRLKVNVPLDACDWNGVDVCHIVDEVASNLTSKVDSREGIAAGDSWVLIAKSQFMSHLNSGGFKSAYSNGFKNSVAGVDRVFEIDDNLATYVDPADPESEVLDYFGNSGTLTGYPAPGATVDYFADCATPSDLEFYLINPSNAFIASQPDTTLGMEMSHDSLKGNMVHGGFMESHLSFNYDGCHPIYHVTIANAASTGAKVGNVAPVTSCP